MSSRERFVVDCAGAGERLDRALVPLLEARLGARPSRRQSKALVEGGHVWLGGRQERYGSKRLRAGDRLQVDAQALEQLLERLQAEPERVELPPEAILYEDEDVLAVCKPAGLPSQATRDPDRDHLLAALGRLLRRRGDPDPYLVLPHRLDVETSGVMVLARSERANPGLTDAFRVRVMDKRYRALVVTPSDPLPEKIEDHLAPEDDPAGAAPRQVRVHAGGDLAFTRLWVRQHLRGALEVEARPHTGRRHQVRAHLSGAGAPILGDELYGGPRRIAGVRAGRVMLHAWKLKLPHPITGEPLQLECDLPPDYVSVRESLAEEAG